MTPRPATTLVAATLVAGVLATAWAQSVSTRSAAHRPGVMDHVRALDGAVIHGDLAAVRAAATWLADQAAPWTPPQATEPQVRRLRDEATAVARAPNLAEAATGTAVLFASCGNCHEAARVRPAVPRATPPTLASIPGRMRRHLEAADLMLEGLVVPSPEAWTRGAGQLREAPLRPGDYPVSERIGALMAEVAGRVRIQAADAATAADTASRTRAYAALLVTCSECHTRHTTLWPRELQ